MLWFEKKRLKKKDKKGWWWNNEQGVFLCLESQDGFGWNRP